MTDTRETNETRTTDTDDIDEVFDAPFTVDLEIRFQPLNYEHQTLNRTPLSPTPRGH